MARDKTRFTEDGVAEPFPVEDAPWTDWARGERFGGRKRRLGAFGGGSRVGVVMEELSPGRQSCPAHYHMLEEEHLLALEGRATLRLGTRTYALSAGDYVCFPAGQKAAHALVNDGDAPFRYLMIGERNPNDVIVYPDSGKVAVRSIGEIYDRSATMGYWDGEDPGSGGG